MWSVFKVQNFSPLVPVIFTSSKWSPVSRGHDHSLLSPNSLLEQAVGTVGTVT